MVPSEILKSGRKLDLAIERVGNVGVDVGEAVGMLRGDVIEDQLADDAVNGDIGAHFPSAKERIPTAARDRDLLRLRMV
jgi:hypothetical protein